MRYRSDNTDCIDNICITLQVITIIQVRVHYGKLYTRIIYNQPFFKYLLICGWCLDFIYRIWNYPGIVRYYCGGYLEAGPGYTRSTLVPCQNLQRPDSPREVSPSVRNTICHVSFPSVVSYPVYRSCWTSLSSLRNSSKKWNEIKYM